MHELSLVTAMVQQVQAIMEQEGVQTVTSISIAIGALSGVESGSFAFCFPLVTEKTSLQEATLCIDKIPLRVRCHLCGKESCPESLVMICMHCNANQVDVVAGMELNILSLEVC